MMTYYIFRVESARNRAYVIDLKGNKVYYGTMYQCRKFVQHMTEEGSETNDKEVGTNRKALR